MFADRPRQRLGAFAAICAGAGADVVLIHGVGLRAEAWSGQFETLIESYRVTAIDLPGHGESDALASLSDVGDISDAIVEVLPTKATLIGHSLGALVALDLGLRYPGRVKALAAMNAVYERAEDARAAVLARADALDGVTTADPSNTLRRWFGDAVCDERTACEHWLRTVDPKGYRDAYRAFAVARDPTVDDLDRLDLPALFLTGSQEPNSTPAMSERLAQLTPKGMARVIPGAAHMMPMTHAREVNEILLDFLQTVHGT